MVSMHDPEGRIGAQLGPSKEPAVTQSGFWFSFGPIHADDVPVGSYRPHSDPLGALCARRMRIDQRTLFGAGLGAANPLGRTGKS